MINFLDRIYTKIEDKNVFLKKLKFYSIQRFLITLIANILIPILFRFNKQKHKLIHNKSSDRRYVVTLTTFPKRINKVWLGIETILRQDKKPDKIILWLSKNQFKSINDLPFKLKEQQERGLEIRLVDDDIRSHKKYFYALQEFPDDYLITIDDDIFYPSNIIDFLISNSITYPNCVCCNRANFIKNENKDLSPYKTWEECREKVDPTFEIFFTSGGGTLFPPKSLHSETINKKNFLEECPDADDIWLNAMCRINHTPIFKTEYYSSLLPIVSFNNENLHSKNLGGGQNDIQLKNVRNYCIKKLGIDPFKMTKKSLNLLNEK
jgi:hypothetical protein